MSLGMHQFFTGRVFVPKITFPFSLPLSAANIIDRNNIPKSEGCRNHGKLYTNAW